MCALPSFKFVLSQCVVGVNFSQVKVVLPNAECSLLSLCGMNCMNLKFSLLLAF